MIVGIHQFFRAVTAASWTVASRLILTHVVVVGFIKTAPMLADGHRILPRRAVWALVRGWRGLQFCRLPQARIRALKLFTERIIYSWQTAWLGLFCRRSTACAPSEVRGFILRSGLNAPLRVCGNSGSTYE